MLYVSSVFGLFFLLLPTGGGAEHQVFMESATKLQWLVSLMDQRRSAVAEIRDKVSRGEELHAGGKTFSLKVMRLALEIMSDDEPVMGAASSSSTGGVAADEELPELLEREEDDDDAGEDILHSVSDSEEEAQEEKVESEAENASVEGTDGEDFMPAKYLGFLSLNHNDDTDKTELYHSRSSERLELPVVSGMWSLDVGIDGDALVFEVAAHDEPQVFDVHAHLKHQLFT